MSIDISSLDNPNALLEFTRDAGIELPTKWAGREVTIEEITEFAREIEPRIIRQLKAIKKSNTKVFKELSTCFGRVGTKNRYLFEKDILQLYASSIGVVCASAGSYKKLSKFWKKHKKEIIIGGAIVILVVGVAAVCVCTAGTAGSAGRSGRRRSSERHLR